MSNQATPAVLGLEIEAAPEDITITVEGIRKPLTALDPGEPIAPGPGLTVYTSAYGGTIRLPASCAAVQVAADLSVLQVVRPERHISSPLWREAGTIRLIIPRGGLVLVALGEDGAHDEARQYLESRFKPGDRLKLRKHGELIAIGELTCGNHPQIVLDRHAMFSTSEPRTTITGTIRRLPRGTSVELRLDGQHVVIREDGTFSATCALSPGANYVGLALAAEGQTLDRSELAIFCRHGLERLAERYASAEDKAAATSELGESTDGDGNPDGAIIQQQKEAARTDTSAGRADGGERSGAARQSQGEQRSPADLRGSLGDVQAWDIEAAGTTLPADGAARAQQSDAGQGGSRQRPEVILWVDQGANSRRFQSPEQVETFLRQARSAGVTMIVLDVLGVEGFVTYRKTTLTGRPHASRIRAAKKAGAHPELDLLELFVAYGHQLGLRIHASINVFAEGSILYGEYGVLNEHPGWEEQLRSPGDGGEIKRQRESADPGVVAFVNPAHDEARAYQLRTFEEIMTNYKVDGIVHDRSRYDNEYADFSETSRIKFEAFLAARGKRLRHWPDDIYVYAADMRINGPLLQDWWEFRAETITSFLAETRELADACSRSTGRRIEMSAYVGSWYERYYEHGANWCSPRFQPDARLSLEPAPLYTPSYLRTGYTDHLDFLIIGAYQQTAGEIDKYVTQAQIVTMGELPIYTGLAVGQLAGTPLLAEACRLALQRSDGIMLFDASHIDDWGTLRAVLGQE
ncbi:hypothetical protein PA598K_05719 [Paenibacillus sp. 598K]|uniref:alpha amylase family protein n=1 Tax=Paenibacillus sp. 598K TaxID=1117987 RepID=UPI000FF997B8|nr:alpha amylase family protein [Paenibacillus sp. 598K]GBF77184.1 hypothetical protein PA598K_05719 [Paenibacillus sp. 598K]